MRAFRSLHLNNSRLTAPAAPKVPLGVAIREADFSVTCAALAAVLATAAAVEFRNGILRDHDPDLGQEATLASHV